MIKTQILNSYKQDGNIRITIISDNEDFYHSIIIDRIGNIINEEYSINL